MKHSRIEAALERALTLAAGPDCPPRLAAAMRDAIFPGGGRVRPALTLAVAKACGEDDPAMTDACAAAVELMHCASLVHDDLPC
ncbi:MAG: polyprenyl synthetase family protein, partial [Myxococcales bacterium]|nr:polyprenyl synthetase family protein [Myxococcales bacterium]